RWNQAPFVADQFPLLIDGGEDLRRRDVVTRLDLEQRISDAVVLHDLFQVFIFLSCVSSAHDLYSILCAAVHPTSSYTAARAAQTSSAICPTKETSRISPCLFHTSG